MSERTLFHCERGMVRYRLSVMVVTGEGEFDERMRQRQFHLGDTLWKAETVKGQFIVPTLRTSQRVGQPMFQVD